MNNKALVYNTLGLICAIFSLATGWFWVYYINLFTALPTFLLGLFITSKAKKAAPGNKFSRFNIILLWTSVFVSVVFLFIFMTRSL